MTTLIHIFGVLLLILTVALYSAMMIWIKEEFFDEYSDISEKAMGGVLACYDTILAFLLIILLSPLILCE